MTNITTVFSWKFPSVEGIETRNGVVTSWPDGLGGTNMPDAKNIAAWTAEYDLVKSDTKCDEIWSSVESNKSGAIALRAVVKWIGELQVPAKSLSKCTDEIKSIIKSML